MSPRHFHSARTEAEHDNWLNRIDETGKAGKPLPSITSDNGGGKFATDGRVLPYPGNTFICHIDKSSREYTILCELQEKLKTLPTARYFTFLPHESFHMTVFCGISGNPLDTDGWPDGLERGLSLAEMNRRFLDACAGIDGFPGVTVRADHLKAGYSIHAEPATQESFDELWRMRDRLAEATGLRREDHDHYQFHISFAYRIRRMPLEIAMAHIEQSTALFEAVYPALQAIRLGPVEFCSFDTMHHFHTEKRLMPKG